MTRRGPTNDEIERLLRETFPENMPRDVEGRLRAAMRPSWRTAVARASESESPEGRAGQEDGGQTFGAWSPQRAFLAVAAVLMLAVGWVFHLEADAGPVARSFQAQQAAVRVAFALGRVSAMGCRLETRDSQGRRVRFEIDWRATTQIQVRVEGPKGVRQLALQASSRTASVLALAREGPALAATRPDAPELAPARDFLTPERLVSLLAGRWERVPSPAGARPGAVTFSVSDPGRRDRARVTIDTETSLPLSLEQALPGPDSPGDPRVTWTRARFVWTPVPPSLGLLGDRSQPGAAPPVLSWS